LAGLFLAVGCFTSPAGTPGLGAIDTAAVVDKDETTNATDVTDASDGPHDAAPCPPPVSFQGEIGPLLAMYCAGYCHAAGEEWSTCTKTQKKSTSIKNYVKNDLMPPAGSPAMSSAERQLLYDWIALGKPCDNTCP
jgi:hypothetical protein